MNNWIPIVGRDTLPDFDVPVLVSGDKGTKVLIARLESVRESSAGLSLDWLEGTGYDTLWYEVEAWQPKPEPYTPN